MVWSEQWSEIALPRREEYRLRSIEERDLETVLLWRNSDRIRANMYTGHEITRDEHQAWFERHRSEPTPTVLVFEFRERPIGIVNVTQIDNHNGKCYWGFYIGDPEAPPGSGTALGYFGLNYIFDVLKIRKLCAEAFAFNVASIKFHKKLGFVEEGLLARHVQKDGHYEDVIPFALFANDWMVHKIRIEASCFKDEPPA